MKETKVQYYNQFKKTLEDCESEFLINEESSLFKMLDLYEKLHETNYHDLSDSIELWISEYPKKTLLEYIRLKQYPNYVRIIEILENNNL